MNPLPVACFAILGLVAPLLTAQPPRDEPAGTPHDLREVTLKADRYWVKGKAYKAWFTAVGKAELPALTKDPDTGVALQAAWEMNKKPAKRPEPLPNRTDYVFSPAGQKAFVAFVRERTKAPVPGWWAEAVTQVDLFPGRHHGFIQTSRVVGREGVRLKEPLPSAVRWEVKGKSVVFTSGGKSAEFPLAAIGENPPEALAGVVAEGWAAVAHYGPGGGSPYGVFGFGRPGGRPTWKSTSWAVGRFEGNGHAGHRVEAVEHDAAVFLFGVESHGAYIEAFDGLSGRCRFRFCSSYWNWNSEAWDLK